jgi:S-adenosylmethionine:tRNA ribosyltransferase-isomerase
LLSPDLQLSSYDYQLPLDRIAQNPVVPRDHSRLLVVPPQGESSHHRFYELPQLLQPGDLLVLNNTKVIPARLYGTKVGSTKVGSPPGGGAKVEVLLIEEKQPDPKAPQWLALVKPGRRLKPGAKLRFGGEGDRPLLQAKILANDPDTGGRLIQFQADANRDFWSCLEQLGEMPLPPYITQSQADQAQYQTIYSKALGAVAAPTAGLHFTPELMKTLESSGIDKAFVTLHVGVGTFRPVETETITDHQMHGEWVEVPPETVAKIQATQARGGRIIAVGTTAVRSLEGAAQGGKLEAIQKKVNLFIYPGYHWQVVDGLITNFHLPKSSLMMLVSAMTGRDRLLNLYQTAIEADYRFYSFGDAMLILPGAMT